MAEEHTIVSVAGMRALEAAAFDSGISEAGLQERAGSAVADAVQRLVTPGDSVVVLSGRGNNGRDGAVAARRLALSGATVHLVLTPSHAVTEAEIEQLRSLGAQIHTWDDPDAVSKSAAC
jgi:ADP-dependent NAD(P)H-hydrate dehydratase / NAD(P)H-hydrate epimerase